MQAQGTEVGGNGHLCSDPFLHSEYQLKLLPLVMNDVEAQRLGGSLVCMGEP